MIVKIDLFIKKYNKHYIKYFDIKDYSYYEDRKLLLNEFKNLMINDINNLLFRVSHNNIDNIVMRNDIIQNDVEEYSYTWFIINNFDNELYTNLDLLYTLSYDIIETYIIN